MKIAVFVAIIIAIIALVCASVMTMRWHAALRMAVKKTREASEAEAKLRQAETRSREFERSYDKVSKDSEEMRERLEKLNRLAYMDANTDLPNRQKLTESFEAAFSELRSGEEIGLALFEFRGAETSVSLLGRNNAEMKQEILQRLKNAMNADDELVSLADDAVALLTKRVQHRKDYEGQIDKIFKLLTLPVMSNGSEVTPTVYGAVVLAPDDGNTMQLLDMNLGLAMSSAMAQPESTYCFYDPEIAVDAMKRMSRQATVTDAVRNNTIEYPLTPRVRPATGQAVQLAVTPVLKTPDGLIDGRQLLTLIDSSGHTMVVYATMLKRVCDCLQHYAEMGISDVHMSIPVTERMFNNREFVKTTYDVLQGIELDMRRVMFEVGEQTIMANPREASDKMRRLMNFGVRFVLEADGIPAVPVWLLPRMPIDAWKLADMTPSEMSAEEQEQMLGIVARTAHSFGVQLICPGVDTAEEEALAVACGVDCVQGKHYGDAISEELAGRLFAAMK